VTIQKVHGRPQGGKGDGQSGTGKVRGMKMHLFHINEVLFRIQDVWKKKRINKSILKGWKKGRPTDLSKKKKTGKEIYKKGFPNYGWIAGGRRNKG